MGRDNHQRPRGQALTGKTTLGKQEKALRVAELRLRGLSYPVIHREHGIPPATAHRLVKELYEQRAAELGDRGGELVQQEADRLDLLQAALMPRALGLDAEGNPTGEGPHLPSVDRVLRIIEQRRGLFGLDKYADRLPTAQAVFSYMLPASLPEDVASELLDRAREAGMRLPGAGSTAADAGDIN